MAQRTQTVLVDDIDGGDADETVSFALDGVSYEIELSAKNAAALRGDLASWVGHGRRVSGRTSTSTARRSSGRSASGTDTAAVREWARKNGHTVSDRGRISAKVTAAYQAAQK